MIRQGTLSKHLYTVCIVLGMVVFLAGCSSTGQRNAASAVVDTELAASVVYLRGDERPEQLNRLVQPGTVVVWLNKCGEDIRIVFPERRVTIACLNPVSFTSDADGIFESKVMPAGAVASLCFIQPGLYAYSVEQIGGGAIQHGTIVVK